MGLDAAFFARAATIVRNRRHVLDRADLQTDRLNGANRGLTTGAGTFDPNFHFLHAVRHRLTRGVLRDLLGGVSGAFARAFETDPTRAGPADEISLRVGDRDLRVVERGQNICDAGDDILGVLGLDDLFRIGVFTQKFGSGRGFFGRLFPRRFGSAFGLGLFFRRGFLFGFFSHTKILVDAGLGVRV